MMQFSTLDHLLGQHSRYMLVVAVAKRARQLTEQGADTDRSTKAVTLAIDEIASGSVAVADMRARYG